MTGSLQIKNNRYYVVLNDTDEFGKRRQRWISTNLEVKGNKKRATEFLRKTLEERLGWNLEYDSLLLSDYFEQWLESQKTLVSKSTFRSYEINMRNHIIPYFKALGIKISALKVYHLEDYYHFKLTSPSFSGKPLSAQTIRHHHQNISKALNDAVHREIIPYNPAQNARTPKVSKYVGTFLNPNQLKELIGLFLDTPIENLVKFIATYGLRRSEALGLSWKYVDFENGQFTIARTVIQNTGEDYIKDHAKNESSYRTLPMTTNIKKLLLRVWEQQKEYARQFGNQYHQSDFVFTWPDGHPISPNYLTSKFHSVISKSALPAIRLHDLRHSTASNLLANNTPIADVQQWLGHSRASTTLDYYTHVDSSSKKRIAGTLEVLLPLEIR